MCLRLLLSFMGYKTTMTLAARHHSHLLGISDQCIPPLLNRLQFSPTTTAASRLGGITATYWASVIGVYHPCSTDSSSPQLPQLALDLDLFLGQSQREFSSDFHLHLISCHIGVFDDVATFLRREELSFMGMKLS